MKVLPLLLTVGACGLIIYSFYLEKLDHDIKLLIMAVGLLCMLTLNIFFMFESSLIRNAIKRERDEASQQEKFLKAMLNNMPLGVFVKDARNDFRYMLMNKKAEETFGLKEENAIGKQDYDFFPQEESDFFRATDISVMQKGEMVEIEAEPVSGASGFFIAQTHKVPIYDDQGEPALLLGMFKDVTSSIKAKEDLVSAMQDAEKANIAKSEFLANMSHEIRTPINGIMGMAHLLKDTALDGRQQHFADIIVHSSETLLQIINDILDVSKIEAGKMEMEKIPFDLRSLCEEIVEMMAFRTQEKHLEFFHNFHKDCPSRLIGDPGRVRQILLNLCSNAIKFTEIGHVILDISTMELGEKTATIRLSVRDTGIGIPDSKKHNIFEKFDQADTSNTRKYGGTGLGLAITRQLVDLMGGAISFESTEGKGSEFSCYLSFDLAPEEISKTWSPQHINLVESNLRTLIVDDNQISCEILDDILRSSGLERITIEKRAANVIPLLLEAAKSSNPYDLVILDYVMPLANGLEIAQEIKKLPILKDTLVILATSQPMRSDAGGVEEAGIKGYLSKPVRASDLIEMIGMLWDAKLRGVELDMITRYTIRESKSRTELQARVYDNVRILVAEDNPVNQEVMRGLLDGVHIDATIVSNGLEAVAAIQSGSFDIVVMDCQMPEMNGYDATRMIRKLPGDIAAIPVIALTANVMNGDREKCLTAGMNDYLGKPIKEEDLLDAIDKWLPLHKKKHHASSLAAAKAPAEPAPSVTTGKGLLDDQRLAKLEASLKDRFPHVVDTFINSSLSLIEKIEEAITAGDAGQLRESSHSLKSSGQMGATEIYRLAALVEEIAKTGVTSGLDQHVQDLRSEYAAVKEKLLGRVSGAGGLAKVAG